MFCLPTMAFEFEFDQCSIFLQCVRTVIQKVYLWLLERYVARSSEWGWCLTRVQSSEQKACRFV